MSGSFSIGVSPSKEQGFLGVSYVIRTDNVLASGSSYA